ncbi:MAG: hypothetical protein OXI87_14830 [Albidovulum sp.]|nr:hypothetical protein [Albidovulum sp.]MDE0306132.1 hypothetical protein [Albidovulum sp.]MDE0531841.1 hypothetical protein [Albidovulum sp.]
MATKGRLLRMVEKQLFMLGECDSSNDRLQGDTNVPPPKSAPRILLENWEPPDR